MKKCIFITGAGAGIGRATARFFAAQGWFIGAADRDLIPPFVNTGMVQSNEGRSASFDSMGINLNAEIVAAEVWEQVRKPWLHRPVSMQFRAFWPITRTAPIGVTRAVMKRLWGKAQKQVGELSGTGKRG